MKKLLISTSLFLAFFVLFSAVILELFARYIIIPKDFKYISVKPNEFPYFELVNSHQANGITIKEGRREYFPRGKRNSKVAFIGDSITFCATVSDKHCFVEQIQINQDKFDTYNFGVPGYGLLDIQQVLEREAQNAKYAAFVYVFNFNDVFPAQPVLLSLLSNSENRFASVHDYGDSTDKLRGFVKDHFKILPTGKYLWGAYGSKLLSFLFRPAHIPPAKRPSGLSSVKKKSCYEKTLKAIEQPGPAYFYNRVYPAWQKMYRDPMLMSRFNKTLLEMKKRAQNAGAQLLVVPFHDSIFYAKKNDQLRDILVETFKTNEIDYVDTWTLFQSRLESCDLYADPGHPGKFGNQILAETIQKVLLERYLGPKRLAGANIQNKLGETR